MIKDSISVILPVHNQEGLIGRVIESILNNKSENIKEFIIVIDGCTDKTEDVIRTFIPKIDVRFIPITAFDVNEVIANNMGLRMSNCQYSLLIQDDVVITEKDFDKRMLEPFSLFDNLLAVSGRDAADVRITDIEKYGYIEFHNMAGRDKNPQRDIFAVRDIVNRPPILVDNYKMKALNYFDEEFAPITQDDTDLGFRAYEFGWIVGSYIISYDSDLMWSFNRRDAESTRIRAETELKNLKKIASKYADVIAGERHSADYRIIKDVDGTPLISERIDRNPLQGENKNV